MEKWELLYNTVNAWNPYCSIYRYLWEKSEKKSGKSCMDDCPSRIPLCHKRSFIFWKDVLQRSTIFNLSCLFWGWSLGTWQFSTMIDACMCCCFLSHNFTSLAFSIPCIPLFKKCFHLYFIVVYKSNFAAFCLLYMNWSIIYNLEANLLLKLKAPLHSHHERDISTC